MHWRLWIRSSHKAKATETHLGIIQWCRRSGASGAEAPRFQAVHIGDGRYTASKLTLNSKQRRKDMEKILSRIGLAALVITVVALLTPLDRYATAAGQAQAATSAAVKIDNFSFGPAAVTVPVGTTVTWTNQDDIPHTVVSTDGVFKSKALDTDDKFSFVFNKPGTYSYFCSIHPKMTGQIIVQ